LEAFASGGIEALADAAPPLAGWRRRSRPPRASSA
jgi:hypothetical protein